MMCPVALRLILKRVMMLNFEEEPPYDDIIELMKLEICKKVRIGPDLEPIIQEIEW